MFASYLLLSQSIKLTSMKKLLLPFALLLIFSGAYSQDSQDQKGKQNK